MAENRSEDECQENSKSVTCFFVLPVKISFITLQLPEVEQQSKMSLICMHCSENRFVVKPMQSHSCVPGSEPSIL